MYNVQCTMYNVQCTMYSVQCTVYSVQTSTQLPTTRPYFILGLIRIMHARSINHKFRIYVDFGATSSKPYPDNQYVLQLPTPLLQPPLPYSDIQYVRPGPTLIFNMSDQVLLPFKVVKENKPIAQLYYCYVSRIILVQCCH